MADRLTPAQRSQNMSLIHGRNTKPELTVRRVLHALGYRFRLHRRDLPGKPDLVLAKWKLTIFVHGCFWHKHDCHLFRWPATRQEFWHNKISGNMKRDGINANRLQADGWRVLTVWECAMKGKGRLKAEELEEKLRMAVQSADRILSIRGN